MLRQRYADRGVSPVVGVVLMVAITVILAATAASFLVGIGNQRTSGQVPTVAFDHSFTTDDRDSHVLEISHRGGDSVEPESLRVVVSHAACDGTALSGRFEPHSLHNADSRLVAGSTLRLDWRSLRCSTRDLDLSRAEVTVTWIEGEGATSSTLWQWTGPSA